MQICDSITKRRASRGTSLAATKSMHRWTTGHHYVSISDPLGNDYCSEKCLEAYVSAFCIFIEFSEHLLVEGYHEFTHNQSLEVRQYRAMDHNRRTSTMCST